MISSRKINALLVFLILIVSLVPYHAFAAFPDSSPPIAYHNAPPIDSSILSGVGVQDAIPDPSQSPVPPAVGNLTLIVLAVEFSDLNHTVSITTLTDKFFSRMRAYFAEVSFGQLTISGKVVGWYRVPYPLAYYGRDGLTVDDCDFSGQPCSWKLLRDAVPLAQNDVNFDLYQYVAVVHAGNGQETSGISDDIWSVAYLGGIWIPTNQRSIGQFDVVPEVEAKGADTVGVYAHEFSHLLGLPDLYDPLTRQSYVGPWGVMDRGLWNGNPRGSSPAHHEAWSKITLGWIPINRIAVVNASLVMNVTLRPLESQGLGFYVAKVPISSSFPQKYYLVEVRQLIGFDKALPSSGVLVSLIDERADRGKVRIQDANPSTAALTGAAYQLGQAFADSLNGIIISVVAKSAEGFLVNINRLGPAPDLFVDTVTASPSSPSAGQLVTFTVRIGNQGTAPSGPFTVAVFLNGKVYTTFAQTDIPAGQSTTLTFTWNATLGLFNFRVIVDPTNSVVQITRANKDKTISLLIGYTIIIWPSPTSGDSSSNATYWIKVNGARYNATTSKPVKIKVLNGTQTIEIQAAIMIRQGTRWFFVKWNDGSTDNPRTFQISGDISISPVFKTQFLLNVDSNGGIVVGGGWLDTNATTTVTANTPSNLIEGKSRWVFVKWTGDVSSDSATVTIQMTAPRSLKANWKIQYYVRIQSAYGTTPATGWYDGDQRLDVILPPTIDHANRTRRIFLGWSGDMSGSQGSVTVVVNGPKTLIASWKTQFYVEVVSAVGDPKGTGWYDTAAEAKIKVNPAVEFSNRTRLLFVKWTGDYQSDKAASSLSVNSPKLIVANWKTQYQLTFTTRGLPNGTSLVLTVNGAKESAKTPLAVSEWVDSGSNISFTSNSTVRIAGWNYRLVRWELSNGRVVTSPSSVTSPDIYMAVYIRSSLLGCFIATATYESELSPQVQFLRDFRDETVMNTRVGSAFMSAFNAFYYSFSPQVAVFVSENEQVRYGLRVILYPLISTLQASYAIHQFLGGELGMVVAGLTASTLLGLIYVGPLSISSALVSRRLKRFTRQAARLSFVALALACVALGVAFALNLPLILSLSTSAMVLATVVFTASVVGAVFPTKTRH